jgi:uncharacterized DUF497 family protein
MVELSFEWDKEKERRNIRRHGVSFAEAQTAFYDENARIIHDPDHSDAEDRFILLGISAGVRLLLVCHCYRKNDEVISIISARKAEKKEAGQYCERILLR